MNNDIIQQIKCEFDNWVNKPIQLYNVVKENIVSQKMSKGKLFNILPYENELNGFKKGKEIKSKPKDNKDLVVYYFDNLSRVVLIEEFGTVENPYQFYVYYDDDKIRIYGFNTNGCLMFIRYAIKYCNQVKELYNWGEYGASYEEYIYNLHDKPCKIIRTEAVTTNDSFVREINFYYDENDEIKLIEQDNYNGYIQELYPKLGKWRKSLA